MTSQELCRMANRLRLDVVETVERAGDGHPGPCMSIAEIIALLYFEEMNIRPDEPHWAGRDRFLLSKGHACPILYAALARRGYFPLTELAGLRSLESMLQGHPDMNKTPGIDFVSGSLGNGVALGVGMALGLKLQKNPANVFVVVGDGEMEEGVIWEAAMNAAHHGLNNLIVFGDCNHQQSGGTVDALSALNPVCEKWRAFHWQVTTVDGHDIDALKAAIAAAKAAPGPSFIEMRTVKGKNISFMENNNAWHKRVPTPEEVEIARRELGAMI